MKYAVLVLLLATVPAFAATPIKLKAVDIARDGATHPGTMDKKYEGKDDITVVGKFLDYDTYGQMVGTPHKAILMEGMPGEDVIIGSKVQFNPLNNDDSVVPAGFKKGQQITAHCTKLKEVLEGQIMLTGCTFK
ncbi:hypothetical protein [Dyella sp.]|uniref:hypothetical protein n=1 Tax=Dyella sp. TaxID=1869338 RepID=UPI002ED43786